MESKHNPYWYKLIKKLKERKEIGTGLTIPYLFGAYEELGQSFESIKDMLEHIADGEIDKYPVISICDKIHHQVLAVYPKQVCHRWKDVGKIAGKTETGKVYVTTESNLGKSKEPIISKLVALYDKPIQDKTFSWNNEQKKWLKFSEHEKEIILSIK